MSRPATDDVPGPVGRQNTRSDIGPGRNRPRPWPLVLPAVLLVMALILPRYILWHGEPAQVYGLGPAAWPRVMLAGVALFSALWLAQEAFAYRRGRPALLAAPVEEDGYRMGKAIVGIGLILLYGWMLPLTGFALTTAVFLIVWCVYGGVRNPLVLLPVSLIGTVVLLWVFMGASLMPLSRGQGPFDAFSIWLLQMLRIY